MGDINNIIKRFCDRCEAELELNYRKLSITTGTDNFLSIKGRMIGGTIHKEICIKRQNVASVAQSGKYFIKG